ncbi:MAG: M20 family metallopeptidase [Conexivisphaerales archaeon]
MNEANSSRLISEILTEIDHSQLLDLARNLVKIPSENPPGEEKGVANFISSWFEKKGNYSITFLEAARNRPNVIVTTEELPGKKILFNGHMDVVPAGDSWSVDPFEAAVIGDRMYGRGAADMKGALAAMMVAMDTVNKVAGDFLQGTIILTAVVDEEKGGSLGSNQIVRKGIAADFAVVGEPTELRVASAHKGNLTFEVTTFGKSAHASMPKNGINAVLKMCAVISKLKKYSDELERSKPHPLLGLPTFNVGTIGGGVKSNVVPPSCRITAERRLIIPEDIERVKDEIEGILKNLANEDPELKYELKFLEEVGPSEMRDGKALLDIAFRSLSKLGRDVSSQVGFGATCDAYYFNSIAKIPTVIIGPGSISDIHRPDESIKIEEIYTAAKFYALTALELLTNQT